MRSKMMTAISALPIVCCTICAAFTGSAMAKASATAQAAAPKAATGAASRATSPAIAAKPPQTSGQQPKAASAQQPPQGSLVTRVHDTGFVQLTADSFNALTPDQKMDAYWLSMAAIAVNPIAYDQNSAYGLREKQVLEAILTHSKDIDPAVLKKITDYTHAFLGEPRKP